MVTSLKINLPTEQDTKLLGMALAKLVEGHAMIGLSGPLGAGKTTLARALITTLTGEIEAPSPSFSLVQIYETQNILLRHFDLYRLKSAEEVWEIGLEDALENGINLIEWPEKIEAYLPHDFLAIQLMPLDDERKAVLTGRGNWSDKLQTLDEQRSKTT